MQLPKKMVVGGIYFTNKTLRYGTLIICIVFLIILGIAKTVDGTNWYFIVLHAIVIILISFAMIQYVFKDCDVVPSDRISYFSIIAAIVLLLIPATLTIVMSSVSYGSVFLIIVISICSGTIAFLLFKKNVPHTDLRNDISSKSYWNNTKDIHLPRLGTHYNISLIFIFLLGFFLRVWVFGTPVVPLGYDVPVYLHLAEEGLHSTTLHLITSGLSVTGNVYQDTWNFSKLWLGLMAKGFGMFNLGTIFVAKIGMPFVSSLSIIIIYFIAKELTLNKNVAGWASLFFAIMPVELLYNDLYKELFGEILLLVALYFIIKLSKKRSYITLALLLFSGIFIWKVAVTVAAKAVMFIVSFIVFLILEKRVYKADVMISGVLLFVALAIMSISGGVPFELVPTRVYETGAYTRLAFPILAVTNMTTFLLTVYYLFGNLIKKQNDGDTNTFAYSLFFSLFIYSFLISGLLGYRIFPSSTLLNNFRFALYLSIPLAIISGIVMDNTLRKITERRAAFIFISIILLTSAIDLGLTMHPATTIHESRLSQYIDDQTYEMLHSISFAEYNNVFVAGNFTWNESTGNYSLGNWIKYIVYSKSGNEAVFIGGIDKYPVNSTSCDLLILSENNSTRIFIYDKGIKTELII